jgi:DNA-binding transcriptional MerR regulator/Flp pilus assembly protein TadD
MATGSGYGFGAAAAILGISESRLRYWSQSGFIGPSVREGGKQVFSFQDLAAVKAAKELIDRGFSTADIRRAIDRVRSTLPGIDRPLEHLRVAFNGTELVLIEDGAAFALSGQRVFDFGLGELRARATGWGRTTPIRSAPEANDLTSSNSTATETAGEPVTTTTAAVGKPDRTGKAAAKAKTAYDWFQEGLSQENHGRVDDAAGAYRRALKLDPGLGAAHTNLGTLAHRRGDVAEARASFEAALAVDPEQPEARYNLAHLLCEAGDFELGAAELRRVLQLAPDFADAHFNLATALETLGGRRQAVHHLEQYLALAASNAGADTFVSEARERISRLGA